MLLTGSLDKLRDLGMTCILLSTVLRSMGSIRLPVSILLPKESI